jgi:hypothetical protein
MGKRKGPADEALLQSYDAVANARFEGKESGKGTETQKGLAETYEQISDDYVSGSNEKTFLRDGEDLGKNDGYRPK